MDSTGAPVGHHYQKARSIRRCWSTTARSLSSADSSRTTFKDGMQKNTGARRPSLVGRPVQVQDAHAHQDQPDGFPAARRGGALTPARRCIHRRPLRLYPRRAGQGPAGARRGAAGHGLTDPATATGAGPGAPGSAGIGADLQDEVERRKLTSPPLPPASAPTPRTKLNIRLRFHRTRSVAPAEDGVGPLSEIGW